MSDAPGTLKERLRSDLTEAIKDRDKLRSGTIRMVLTAITEAEVAGSEAIELSDQQVLDVVIREAKKRREAEAAYANAGRSELAEKERAESNVLADYLPQQLTQDEIAAIVADVSCPVEPGYPAPSRRSGPRQAQSARSLSTWWAERNARRRRRNRILLPLLLLLSLLLGVLLRSHNGRITPVGVPRVYRAEFRDRRARTG